MSVDDLARAGRIIAVESDHAAARRQLERARRHLGTAEREVELGTGARGADVRELDRMRRTRNRVEYGDWGDVGAAELHADLERARSIAAAVEAGWPAG